jgi:putative nucleotidyltransferase with HDIG domain
VAIARSLGLDETRCAALKLASLVHDVGKIHIPSEILNRPGKLDELQMKMVREHAKTGWELFKDVEFAQPIAEIIYQHHERLDGSGYPRGLKEDEILLQAKILAVADVVEAMSSHRPYRQALGIDSALEEIAMNAGRIYDDEVVTACLRVFEEGFTYSEDQSEWSSIQRAAFSR